MQNKFVIKDQFTNYFENSLDKALSSGYNDLQTGVVNSEDITKCDRRIYYSVTSLDFPKNKNLKIHNDFLVFKWVKILGKIENIKVLETNYVVADHNYDFVSKIDIIANILEQRAILMVKEVSEDKFKEGVASRTHAVDLMSQMWLSEVNDGFLIYENVITKGYSIFHILPNFSVLNAVKVKLKDIQQKKMSGILPERKYDKPDANECQVCKFRDKCWSLR